MLRTVYDPEIPVNIYDLGLVYNIEVDDNMCVHIDMTFTAPSCPASEFIMEDVRMKVESIDEVKSTCTCGRKTIINARIDRLGNVVFDGEQVEIGGNDKYMAMCRRCWAKRRCERDMIDAIDFGE